jgi:small subunit ribosomal protein S24e
MKIVIKKQKSNPLLKRNEVYFEVNHTGECTPKRNAVADEIAKMLKSKRDSVVVDDFQSDYGIGTSQGYAKVYESKEAALEFEKEHLLKRNGIEKDKPVDPKAEE